MSTSLPLPAGRNVDAVAGAPEAILSHEVTWEWKPPMGGETAEGEPVPPTAPHAYRLHPAPQRLCDLERKINSLLLLFRFFS